MSFTHFPDGIKVGPDSTGNDRLPLFEFDEWLANDVVVGTLAAGEIKDVEISGVLNIRAGQTVLRARPASTSTEPINDYQYLLTIDAWVKPTIEVVDTIVVRVKNIHSEEIDFITDAWLITHLNTANP